MTITPGVETLALTHLVSSRTVSQRHYYTLPYDHFPLRDHPLTWSVTSLCPFIITILVTVANL